MMVDLHSYDTTTREKALLAISRRSITATLIPDSQEAVRTHGRPGVKRLPKKLRRFLQDGRPPPSWPCPPAIAVDEADLKRPRADRFLPRGEQKVPAGFPPAGGHSRIPENRRITTSSPGAAGSPWITRLSSVREPSVSTPVQSGSPHRPGRPPRTSIREHATIRGGTISSSCRWPGALSVPPAYPPRRRRSITSIDPIWGHRSYPTLMEIALTGGEAGRTGYPPLWRCSCLLCRRLRYPEDGGESP